MDTVPQSAGAVQFQKRKSFSEPLQLRGELRRRDPFCLDLAQITLVEFQSGHAHFPDLRNSCCFIAAYEKGEKAFASNMDPRILNNGTGVNGGYD